LFAPLFLFISFYFFFHGCCAAPVITGFRHPPSFHHLIINDGYMQPPPPPPPTRNPCAISIIIIFGGPRFLLLPSSFIPSFLHFSDLFLVHSLLGLFLYRRSYLVGTTMRKTYTKKEIDREWGGGGFLLSHDLLFYSCVGDISSL
jgi:hypothetical protein